MTPIPECAFLFPIHRDKRLSDGELHSTEAWNWLTDQVYERFDGVTIDPDLYKGMWKHPQTGERVSDQSRRYIVALSPERLDELRRLLVEACSVFQQQCIYLSIAGQFEFVEVPPDAQKP